MTKNRAYSRAYTEVLEITKHFPVDEYNRIPKEKIAFWERNSDREYHFSFNPEASWESQNISLEANAVIVKLFLDYYATEDQKKTVKEILLLNKMKNHERYNEKSLWDKNMIKEIDNFAQGNAKMPTKVENKSFFSKIFVRIKEFFKFEK